MLSTRQARTMLRSALGGVARTVDATARQAAQEVVENDLNQTA